jgi:ribosome-associated toxin RatA of RatAB toxin-antitoxin module
MPIAEGRIHVAASQADVFDLAQDYDRRLEWDPFLRQIRMPDGAAANGVGARVWVVAKNGLSMEVIYIAFDRPRTVAMKMTEGPRMFKHFAGTWRFERRTERLTEVTFRYGFETTWSFLRPMLNPVIRSVLTRDIRRRLEGLERGAEGGGGAQCRTCATSRKK